MLSLKIYNCHELDRKVRIIIIDLSMILNIYGILNLDKLIFKINKKSLITIMIVLIINIMTIIILIKVNYLRKNKILENQINLNI
jgi:hypothetical protein